MLVLSLIGCDGAEAPASQQPDTVEPVGCSTRCPEATPQNGDSCGWHAFCYYADACTSDASGVVATCDDGKVQLGYDLVEAVCGTVVPKDGDPCPCGAGNRQEPCSFACDEGGSLEARCDPATLKWKVSAPAACTTRAAS